MTRIKTEIFLFNTLQILYLDERRIRRKTGQFKQQMFLKIVQDIVIGLTQRNLFGLNSF